MGATAVLLTFVGTYVGGYFVLGRYHCPEVCGTFSQEDELTKHTRQFQSNTVQRVYYPMGWLECRFRDEPVFLYAPDRLDICY